MIRLLCYLAVVCGVSLRHLARLLAVLCLIPITKSSMKRWIDDIGVHLPTPEAMLRQLLAPASATECYIDGSDPLGRIPVMVVKDEQDRILITHEAASENGEDARQFLQRCKDLGLKVTAACSDYSQSCTEAIKAVYPRARLQADHCHTVKHIWGPLKSRCSPTAGRSRRVVRKRMSNFSHEPNSYGSCVGASWKKPGNVSVAEKQALAELEREAEGFVQSFRHMIRQLVTIFDHAHSEAQAKR